MNTTSAHITTNNARPCHPNDDGVPARLHNHNHASRLVERGVPLAQVRDLLGHASITTTERYDNQKLENLQTAELKLESGKTFDPNDSNRAEKRHDDPGQSFNFLSRSGESPDDR